MMIISTEDIKKYIPELDLPKCDIIIGERLFRMIKHYEKLSESGKAKVKRKVMNSYRCTYKLTSVLNREFRTELLIPVEIKSILGVNVSKPLIIAKGKEVIPDNNITKQDIDREIEIVKRIMEEYRDKVLNTLKSWVEERRRIANHYRRLLKKHGVGGRVIYDRIHKITMDYECVYEGLVYNVYVAKKVCKVEKDLADLYVDFKYWAESFVIIDENTVTHLLDITNPKPISIHEVIECAKESWNHEHIIAWDYNTKEDNCYVLFEKDGKKIVTKQLSKVRRYIVNKELDDRIIVVPIESVVNGDQHEF